jgi:UDP-N-acetylmuramate-alanine ligase
LRLHIIGVGGTAALAAALHAKALGVSVSGYDQALAAESAAILRNAGIPVGSSASPEVLQVCAALNADSVVAISKAITSTQPDHPEALLAREAGARAVSVQQVIADAAATRGGLLIGVAGTHGKTTSTGWVLDALTRSGIDLSAFVGGPLGEDLGTPTGAPIRIGSSPGFVVEADEYGGNFDVYNADRALILNVDWDHPDIFADRQAAVATFAQWVSYPAKSGVVFINAGDQGGAELAVLLATVGGGNCYTFSTSPSAGAEMVDLAAEVTPRGEGSFAITITHLSDRADGIERSLATFGGVGRRMEVRYDHGSITVLDDYGHHPTAIDATMETVRQRYPGRTLVLAIEPLTYHRTAALLEGLAQSCSSADRVVVAEIFAVRDLDTTSVSAADLAERIAAIGTPATAPGTVLETAAALLPSITPGTVVLVMGGGRSTELAAALARGLTAAS